jgi:hypothetical protein
MIRQNEIDNLFFLSPSKIDIAKPLPRCHIPVSFKVEITELVDDSRIAEGDFTKRGLETLSRLSQGVICN